ncbi:MAG: phosphoglycerate kinase [Candidatus Eisenbacteria bacterium]|nr:phosphoglycerate kinase [Candidatus Eisenbacteria bacterium]
MKKMTLHDADVRGKRVLMRVDFNVPMGKDGTVANDERIRASLPSIRYVLDRGGSLVLMSHLGRPKGKVDPVFSLAPVAKHLAGLLPGAAVRFAEDCVGEKAETAAGSLRSGEVLLLENLRFHAEEEKNDRAFAARLASLGEVYVNDAFGTAHRAHASTAGVTAHFPVRAAGLLMEKEIDYLSRLLENPQRPFVAVLGGAKISGKIDVIRNLAGTVDRLLIGGGMCGTFFAARGLEIGDSLLEEDRIGMARELLESDGARKMLLPRDALVADRLEEDAETRVVPVGDVEKGWRIADIGPETAAAFAAEIGSARTVFWNGPMGVFEMKPFARGTESLARALAEATERGAVTVVGGGDTVRALHEAGVASRVSHVSTGGGASLEFVEGKELPGIAALSDR